MTCSDEEIQRHLRLGEDSEWEFKEIEFSGNQPSNSSRDDWADEIAAFANANGGALLCGVTDEGELQDMSGEQIVNLDSLLVEASSDSIRPAVRIQTYHRRFPGDGRAFLLVHVPRDDFQHDSPGGSYVRVGGSKRRMSSEERLRLAQRRGQIYRGFDKQTVDDTAFGTFDEALWKPLMSAEGAAIPERSLEKMALLSGDDAGVLRATVAGVLLCTFNPRRWLPSACISATRYRGKDRASGQFDAQEITGPLNRQIADAVAFAVRNMHVAARKDPARVDLPQYSRMALFEALVNAVVHRDYSMCASKVRLSMFEDRIEIQSPGSLPNNLTLDSMMELQATRNEVLASALSRMPVVGIHGSEQRRYFMERRGDGVPIIMRETLELSGKRPEYRLIDDSEICLTIPAAVQEHDPARAVITVRSGGRPLRGADVLVLFPNKTWEHATTDDDGEAIVNLHTTHMHMTVFAAALGYTAYLQEEWVPCQGSLAVELGDLPEGGSVIFPEATGCLPGLKGRLSPVRDTHDRTYLYVSNVAINGGVQQPVYFVLGEGLRLTDVDGKELQVRIVAVAGRSALLEYRRTTVIG